MLPRLLTVTQVPDRGVRRADLGVLLPSRHAPATAACLAEIAFLTNPDQSRRLAGEAYRQQIAEALATAILNRVPVPAGVAPPSPGGAQITSPARTTPRLGTRVVNG